MSLENNTLVLISNNHKDNNSQIIVKRDQKYNNFAVGLGKENKPDFDFVILLGKPEIALMIGDFIDYFYGKYYKVFLPSKNQLVFVRDEQLIFLDLYKEVVFI